MQPIQFTLRGPGRYLGFALPILPIIHMSPLVDRFFLRTWPLYLYAGVIPEFTLSHVGMAALLIGYFIFMLDVGLFSSSRIYTLAEHGISISYRSLGPTRWMARLNPGAYFTGTIPYAEITKIEKSTFSTLSIQRGSGKSPVYVDVRELNDPAGFLNKLLEQIPSEKAGPGLQDITRPRRWRVLSNVMTVVAFILIVTGHYLFLSSFMNRWQPPSVWNRPLAFFIQVYSADRDGTIWAMDGENNVVWRVPASGNPQGWQIPKALCDNCFTEAISQDGKENPVVILANKQVIAWDGHSWQKKEIIKDFAAGNINDFTYNSLVWGTNEAKQLVWVNFATNQRGVVLPPAAALEQGMSRQRYQANPDGSLLVYYQGESHGLLARYSDQQWSQVVVTEPGLRDYHSDSQGRLWAIKFENEQALLGRYQPEKDSWLWKALPDLPEHIFTAAVVVDLHDRAWVNTWVADGNDSEIPNSRLYVFDWNDSANPVLISRYVESESLFYTYQLNTTADGRISTMRNGLAWIDGNQETLPQPIPPESFFPGQFRLGVTVAAAGIAILILFSWLERR